MILSTQEFLAMTILSRVSIGLIQPNAIFAQSGKNKSYHMIQELTAQNGLNALLKLIT